MNINFSPIKFVIPSYNRAGKVKTIELLKKNNIDIKQIYIFVVEEEHLEYKKHYPEYKIIIGEKGLVNQRQFINNYFKEGAKIVSMDDDLYAIRQFNEIEGVKTLTDTDLKAFICAGFKECIRVGSRVFGIYPNDNYTRDMSDSITYDLCFLIGHLFGYINRKNGKLKIDYDQKEDYIRSLKYFLLDGVLVRFNNVCCITNTYKNAGGMNTDSNKRIEENNHIHKNDNIVLELVNELENTKFKINYKRLNSGVGLSMTLGSQRIRRKAGVFENTNNKLYPELYNKIKIFANKYISNDYNAIQVNKNYKTQPHRDICNRQNSSILGLGDYKGGKTRINGLLYDIKNKIISFNGKKYLHSNDLSNNNKNRYSLVFFKL